MSKLKRLVSEWTNSGLFLLIFSLFNQIIQILQQIKGKIVHPASQCWDSNTQSIDFESPPFATRPVTRQVCGLIAISKP